LSSYDVRRPEIQIQYSVDIFTLAGFAANYQDQVAENVSGHPAHPEIVTVLIKTSSVKMVQNRLRKETSSDR